MGTFSENLSETIRKTSESLIPPRFIFDLNRELDSFGKNIGTGIKNWSDSLASS